ncbi:MAG TPA: hypothetical protein VMZ29_15610 [Candidatus Bathyarchaeia archaeon]|nr:hypothetical protein [Candidatus Bathyarchaeia archaeon]
MNTKKLIIGLTLIAIFLVPVSAKIAAGENDQIDVTVNNGDVITVTTEKMTIKIIPNQAHLMWWYGVRASTDEVFKLQLVKIREFAGADTILDNRSEFGGLSYNLIRNDWQYSIDLTETELTITLSLIDFLNGADMYVVMHIYNYDTPIPETAEVVDALSEMKFDIIINDWVFSEGAQGYAIQSYLTEVEHHNEVRIRNGTLAENGELKRTMFFESFQYDYDVVAYYEWLEYASVYNNADILIDTIDVGTVFFDDDSCIPPEDVPGFAEGLAHVYLTYPNYGDDNKMVHDPTIGVIDLAQSNVAPLYLLPLLGGLFATAAIVLIVKRKK